ncbi:MAG: peptidylprolyl isomerase [Longimicrobiales bacterium]
MHTRNVLIPILAMTALSTVAQRSAAQVDSTRASGQRDELLAWIVAVVGDSIVSRGDLEEGLAVWVATENEGRQPGPEQRQTILDQVLESRINTLLLLQAAQRDTTIVVSDDDVDRNVEQQIAQIQQQQYGSAAALEQALRREGMSMQEYRDALRNRVRREMYIAQYRQKVRQSRKPPPVTDEEVRAMFDEAANLGQVPMIPPSITFEQVVVPVEPSPDALAAAKTKADSIHALVLEDPDEFAALARRFSEDPGSKEQGGDLGWFRRGQGFVQEFEIAAFRLRQGEISPPVKTFVGYHIIRIERVRGSERQARHILIRPEISEADIARARTRADTVVEKMRAGVRIDSLKRQYGDVDEVTRVGPFPRDSLDSGYATALDSVSRGEIVGPFRIDGPVVKWGVARVLELQDARQGTVSDYRDFLANRIAADKLEAEILRELRRRTYVEIRDPPRSGETQDGRSPPDRRGGG